MGGDGISIMHVVCRLFHRGRPVDRRSFFASSSSSLLSSSSSSAATAAAAGARSTLYVND